VLKGSIVQRQTILRVLVFITALLLTLALPISARWDAQQTPVVNLPDPRILAE